MSVSSIKEVVKSLIQNNRASLAYYNHNPTYSHSSPIEESLKGYDGNDDFYKDYEPVLIMFGHGDYVGSDIDIANMRCIENDYPELFESDCITYQHSGYGYSALVVFFLRLEVARSGLFDTLDDLDDYILLDDDIHTEVQNELLEESWDNWGKSDFGSEIRKRTGYDFTETDWQESLFWELLRHGTGAEYHPEGTSMWIDFKEVFKDSDTLISVLVEHAESLDSGEFEVVGAYTPVGHRLIMNHSYIGETSYDDRIHVLKLHKGCKIDTVPDSILKEFGLKWFQESQLIWEVKPVNEKVKECLGNNPIDLIPIKSVNEFCCNCNQTAACRVLTERGFLNEQQALYVFCPDCYNLLMNYWPKCEQCKVKNVNASLQLSLFPEIEDNPLTHCKECKNTLLAF